MAGRVPDENLPTRERSLSRGRENPAAGAHVPMHAAGHAPMPAAPLPAGHAPIPDIDLDNRTPMGRLILPVFVRVQWKVRPGVWRFYNDEESEAIREQWNADTHMFQIRIRDHNDLLWNYNIDLSRKVQVNPETDWERQMRFIDIRYPVEDYRRFLNEVA